MCICYVGQVFCDSIDNQQFSIFFRRRAGCSWGVNDWILIIDKRGKCLVNKCLPRFFVAFCTFHMQSYGRVDNSLTMTLKVWSKAKRMLVNRPDCFYVNLWAKTFVLWHKTFTVGFQIVENIFFIIFLLLSFTFILLL